jgi:UDP-N-acetylmuramate dehydrogenase
MPQTQHPAPSTQQLLAALPKNIRDRATRDQPLWHLTTLRVGGPADFYYRAATADDFADAVGAAQASGIPHFVLGGGSNICISDRGIRGLVIHNDCRRCDIGQITQVDAGYIFMKLFQDAARHSLSGLEFAVGIPGSVGGAMVSNAGAYRQNICDLVVDIDVVERGQRQTVPPEWMGFSYRDSRLRRPGGPPAAIVAVTLKLEPKPRREILARARDNQRQRIYKQPWYPSAGSFFKNVYDRNLADQLDDLPVPMKEAGVVPSGYLSAACGCKGLTIGGAQISRRHANFVVNRGHATAADIRNLTGIVKTRVRERFGVDLEEEVLYVGDWSDIAIGPA